MTQLPQFEYTERRTFFQRFGLPIGLVVVIGVGVAVLGNVFSKSGTTAPKRAELVMVSLPPPPPPPPPSIQPPPPVNTPRDEMVEQTLVNENEDKPVEATPEAPALGTNVQGSGPPDGFGLGGNRGGSTVGGGSGGRSGGSRFGWYAAQVQKTLSDALRNHPRTRNADFVVTVRIWPDASGRIIKARLAGTTGDSATDSAIADEILPGLQLAEPPPAGMSLPIVMRFTARRPS